MVQTTDQTYIRSPFQFGVGYCRLTWSDWAYCGANFFKLISVSRFR